jgi:L-2-hydroxyglutarate oxidase LhgO
MEKVKITIIGAGVVGLAIAAELGEKYKDIVLVEKESSFGQETSSRNSEIIHAGIYYPKDSLKAKLCVKGKDLLYDYCNKNSIPFAKMGKLIVATSEDEVEQLDQLQKKAEANGVNDLIRLNAKETKEKEPLVKVHSSIFSPSTGIVDSHSLMKSLEREVISNGVMISYQSEVTSLEKLDSGYRVTINQEDDFESEIVINAAGLFADIIAKKAGYDYKIYYCKGDYFAYSKPSFTKHLVYPVPEENTKGLGVHSVTDLGGCLKFGPNAVYVDALNYEVDISQKSEFYRSIIKLFPHVKEGDLQPDQAGIRPKLQGPGDGVKDFVIERENDHLINLIGIESPGLTACLAIAGRVSSLL